MSDTYRDVDGSGSPTEAVAWQRRLNAQPGIVAYKRDSLGRLGDARRVLDVGCGPGEELVALGPRSIGVDVSMTMCRATRATGPVVARADAADLPFADDVFDGARADRVVQHVDDPSRVVQEIGRVVRPGGTVVLADPDQGTLDIRVPGVPDAMVAEVVALRRDVGVRHGRIAATHLDVLRTLGLTDLRVEAHPLVLTDPAEAMGLPGWPRIWRERGAGRWTDEELERWEVALAPGAPAGFRFTLTYLVVSGRVADPPSTAG